MRHTVFLAAGLTLFATLCFGQQVQVTRIEQNDPSIVYAGTWVPQRPIPKQRRLRYIGRTKEAPPPPLSFTGTGITWIGPWTRTPGLRRSILTARRTRSTPMGRPTLYQQPLFSVHGLAAGTHTLSIQVLHVRDGETMGSWIWIDAFVIGERFRHRRRSKARPPGASNRTIPLSSTPGTGISTPTRS